MTAEEFFALGETSENYELVDGVVSMSPRPGSRHQAVLWLISHQFSEFAGATGCRFFPEVDLVLGRGLVYTPDLMCFGPDRVSGFPARLDVPPDLIIEVLSPGNKEFDLTRKKDDYGRFGVPEYWTVDPADARVRCFRVHDGRLDEVQVSGHSLVSTAIAGFVLDLKPLRALAQQE
jgi:Uma2 family endonuclease